LRRFGPSTVLPGGGGREQTAKWAGDV
jgi:hypothetical protein